MLGLMKIINFATTNREKFITAEAICAKSGISIKQIALEIDEIQGEDPDLIVRDKVERAYIKLGRPVLVSDDSWNIISLNGFPGPYMKSINHWFNPEDFLRLMQGIEDRRITLHQYLAFTDGNVTKIFKNDIHGQIINEIRGNIAEVFEQKTNILKKRNQNRPDAWNNFIKWYKQNH